MNYKTMHFLPNLNQDNTEFYKITYSERLPAFMEELEQVNE